MRNQYRCSIIRRLTVTAAVSALLGLGAMFSAVQATESTVQADAGPLLMLAGTDGMERRQGRREERRDDRGDRRHTRQDCREEDGLVGEDKRDCRQDGRQERREDDKD